ncbi:MAG: hypothetical protein Q8O14_15265, partial [bacterium]|nr:hypothetical protein [bacterium]
GSTRLQKASDNSQLANRDMADSSSCDGGSWLNGIEMSTYLRISSKSDRLLGKNAKASAAAEANDGQSNGAGLSLDSIAGMTSPLSLPSHVAALAFGGPLILTSIAPSYPHPSRLLPVAIRSPSRPSRVMTPARRISHFE